MSNNNSNHHAGDAGDSNALVWALGACALAAVLCVGIYALLSGFVASRGAAPGPGAPAGDIAMAGLTGADRPDPVEIAFDEASLARGRAIYAQACVACHGQDMRGGVGLNLVDGEWVHGSSREEILSNIKNGFPDLGMVGFESLYSDEELGDVVDYIRSRREGWEGGRYAIWPIAADTPREGFSFAEATQGEPTKAGRFDTGLADYAIAEMENFAMVVDGIVHIPAGAPAGIWVQAGGGGGVEVMIDGNKVEPVYDLAGAIYPIDHGTHELTIAYSTAEKPGWFSGNLNIVVLNPETGERAFALSEAGKSFLDDTSFVIDAQQRPRVIRRVVNNLPSSTISVGLPSGMNFGFNTRSCAIVGAWQGDFLDIGPNIDGRGDAPAVPLGEWMFHEPEAIALSQDGQCRYVGTSLQDDGSPVFSFEIDGMSYTVTGQPADAGMAFVYAAAGGGAAGPVSVPDIDGVETRVEESGAQTRVLMERTQTP
ncbi:c-type cytochrome [Aquisalinus flavus]|uniref:Cytochrome c domain-containing protein n=1 Tax=Aquisalinus flavus TaxID=1526572 RepID=A0A8J2V4P0_9PROT|nr:cytochrome c [Aquisalinus flavus]MBD0426048.1 cytochrome c [Aquisalinus flavus]UNE48361.1 cytochrome c [Aquisalinus flavus]GGD11141.1 hypothetical protein GCM10011342_19920 [Aquisalinus flavus]